MNTNCKEMTLVFDSSLNVEKSISAGSNQLLKDGLQVLNIHVNSAMYISDIMSCFTVFNIPKVNIYTKMLDCYSLIRWEELLALKLREWDETRAFRIELSHM